jgi:hypothetical protein
MNYSDLVGHDREETYESRMLEPSLQQAVRKEHQLCFLQPESATTGCSSMQSVKIERPQLIHRSKGQ